MSQALFEVPFDAGTRLPLLPRGEAGEYTLFDGNPVQGWCVCYDVTGTPPTVTVRVATSAATMTSLKVDSSLLWLADAGSPVKDETVTPSDANKAEAWLKANGWNKAKDKAGTDKVKAARGTKALTGAVIEDLHDAVLAMVEGQQMQDGWPEKWGKTPKKA